MRFNFKKISAIGASVLLTGMSLGVAAAASYPAPFVTGGSANVATVYGSGASALDQVSAQNIQSDLSDYITSSGSTTVTGESVKLERSSDKFNLGNAATTVFVTSVNKDHLGTMLADKTYRDDDNDEFKYTQKIDLGSWSLTAFRDTDYSDEPEIGVKLDSSTTVLTYTLDFTKDPTFTDAKMGSTDLNILGKNYFVLSVDTTNNALTLLDSAETTTVGEGQTVSVSAGGNTYTVTPSIFGTNNVKLNINGVVTPTLSAGDTYKLSDGSYVGIKELVIQNYQGGQKLAEFSIGAGKLILTNGQDIELNEETITGMGATVTNNSGVLDKIVIQWETDDREFITPTSELVMPGFEAVKVTMGGFNYPVEEKTIVEADGGDSIRLSVPLKDGDANINLLYASSGVITGLGRDKNNKLVTDATPKDGFFYNITDPDDRDKYFVASWNSTAEAESYYLSLQSIGLRDSANRTSIKNEVTGTTICSDLKAADTCTVGNLVLTIDTVHVLGSQKWVNISSGSSGASFDTLYTKEGLKFYLPVDTNTGAADGTDAASAKGEIYLGTNQTTATTSDAGNNVSWYLYAANEDKDSNLGRASYNLTITKNTDNKLHVSTLDIGPSAYEDLRVGDTDKYIYYTPTDVVSMIEHDRTGNQYKTTITYSGEQAYADIFVAASGAVVGEAEAGNMLVTDAELSSVNDLNLVVVGGSCINTAAAQLVGGAYCGASWEAATGVGSGQFLIKGYASNSVTSELALLVAGYDVQDTTNAATYLTTNTIDTSREYKGTSSTSAELVVQ